MTTDALDPPASGSRSGPSILAVAAIAVVAYASCDMVHEVLGHGVATRFVPNVDPLVLSTVALSTSASSRIVAAAGSVANSIAGMLGLALARSGKGSPAVRYFFWLFGSVNLLNATGYPFFSGLFDFGDWSVVVAGLEPHGVWRAVLAVTGMVAYVAAIGASASTLGRLVGGDDVRLERVHRYVVPAYVTGGLLLVAGAIPNPAGPRYILLSGASSGFGAMVGLLWVPRRVARGAAGPGIGLGTSVAWILAAIATAVVFIGVIGPGIRLG
jgi:hypothetical protein